MKQLLISLVLLGSLCAAQGDPQPDPKGTVADAQKNLDADPKNVKLILALGNAQAAVWRMDDAIQTFTKGLAIDPENVPLLLNRGHRYVNTRQWDLALKDLDKAANLVDQNSPDDYEIWYHIGVANYLRGKFDDAADAWDHCRTLATTDDQRAGSTDWSYMTYRRLKRDRDAAGLLDRVSEKWKVTSSLSYFQRLLFYKGIKTEADLLGGNLQPTDVATLNYGIGNWYLGKGDKAKAHEYFQKSVASKAWAAWGYIGSDLELKKGN